MIDDETVVIPGHGSLSEKSDLEDFHEMLVATTDEVKTMMAAGMTLKQMQEEGLSLDWEEWANGFLSTDLWIQIIVDSLNQTCSISLDLVFSMDAEFWHQKWQNNEIGFHQNTVNPFLLRYFETLSLEPGQAIFLPLCGKTLDIGWLLSKSYQVIGIELHEPAVKALFEQLALVPEISRTNKHIKYSYDRLDYICG